MYLKFLLSQGFENTAITHIHDYISSSLGCTMIVQHKQHERMLELFCPRFLFEVIVHASSMILSMAPELGALVPLLHVGNVW